MEEGMGARISFCFEYQAALAGILPAGRPFAFTTLLDRKNGRMPGLTPELAKSKREVTPP
jgi:hypothetical protein